MYLLQNYLILQTGKSMKPTLLILLNRTNFYHGQFFSIIIKIQQDATGAGIYYCKLTLHVSGVYRPHHQEYIKLTQLLVQVISRIRATTFCQR